VSFLDIKMKAGKVLMVLVLIAFAIGLIRLVGYIITGWD
jgi:hypothetical protein